MKTPASTVKYLTDHDRLQRVLEDVALDAWGSYCPEHTADIVYAFETRYVRPAIDFADDLDETGGAGDTTSRSDSFARDLSKIVASGSDAKALDAWLAEIAGDATDEGGLGDEVTYFESTCDTCVGF